MRKTMIVAGLVLSTLGAGQAEAGSKLGAALGGAAVGVVGGAILGSALSAHAAPAPVYVRPEAEVEYIEPAPRPRRIIVADPYEDQVSRLHMRCDDGDRHACIKFGILIGQHRERVAAWRRSHPEYFAYED